MSERSRLHLGLSLSATWWRGGAWREPGSRVEELFDPRLYIELAQRAEAAKLDFLFKPDALQLDRGTLGTWPGFASLEPLVMMTAVATHTERIGLVPTVSSTFNEPYTVARQLRSLDHVSGGRAGWNLVASMDGERNHGLEAMPPSVRRHARAEEFLDVVQQLFASWPAEAQRLDRATGRYADPERVRPIDHVGEHFRVAGPLSLPQRGPERLPLFQAGASEAAQRLAARQADAVFVSAATIPEGQALRRGYGRLALAGGRPERAVRVLPGFAFTLGRSRAEAQELHHRSLAGSQAGAAVNQRTTDRPADDPPPPTPPRGARHGGVVGTADDAFQAIADWWQAGAADGFILLPGGSLTSLHLFLDEVVPRLAEAGLFRSDYHGATLAEHLGLHPAP